MINKVILVGNVGRDPEVRYLDNGVVVAKFPLATSETYTNKSGDKVTNTEWHNIVLWRKLAEVADKWVKKGNPLYIEGKIRSRSYDDKDGIKRYITEIVGDNMQMLGKKSDDQATSGVNQPSSQNNEASFESGNKSDTTSNPFSGDTTPQQDDDLPF